MYVVRNKDTGKFIKSRSGSWNRNQWKASYYKSRGIDWSLWTDDINDAKVYKSKGGIKNSIGVPSKDADGTPITKNVKHGRWTYRRYVYVLPDWAEIVEINIGFSVKE